MANHLRTELTADALGSAVPAWKPGLGVVVHSERAAQDRSADFTSLAEDYRVVLSLGRAGQPWDKALAEIFFASLGGVLTDLQA